VSCHKRLKYNSERDRDKIVHIEYLHGFVFFFFKKHVFHLILFSQKEDIMKKFTVRVPATTANLGPGFDTLGMALEIFNEFEVSVTEDKNLVIEVEGEGKGIIPENEDNLIYQAIEKAFTMAREEVPGLHIHQVNRIPLDRGMGSSATAILGGFFIARHILDNLLSWDDAIQEAVKMEGHPDNIMAAYMGGIVLNYVEGEKTKAVNFSPKHPLRAALVIPEIIINTKEARELLPELTPCMMSSAICETYPC
jgi:homoserine kinase